MDASISVLSVGVGDSIPQFVTKNRQLKHLERAEDGKEFRFLSNAVSSISYDDGEVAIIIKCVTMANVDGNEKFSGVAFVGAKLCGRSVGDWRPAVKMVTQFTEQLEINATVKNLRDFYNEASEDQLTTIGGELLARSRKDNLFKLQTLRELEERFAKEDKEGNLEIVNGLRSSSYVRLGLYASKKALFTVGISKVANFGGSNLTAAQKNTMAYDVTIGIRLRNDANLLVHP